MPGADLPSFAALVATVFRVIRGPTLPDRVLALDMLVGTAIGFIAAIGIKTGFTLYLDIAITLGLVGFLATVAFARFVLTRGRTEKDAPDAPNATGGEAGAAPEAGPAAHPTGGRQP